MKTRKEAYEAVVDLNNEQNQEQLQSVEKSIDAAIGRAVFSTTFPDRLRPGVRHELSRLGFTLKEVDVPNDRQAGTSPATKISWDDQGGYFER